MSGRPFKVWNLSRDVKKGLVAGTLSEVKTKGIIYIAMVIGSSVTAGTSKRDWWLVLCPRSKLKVLHVYISPW